MYRLRRTRFPSITLLWAPALLVLTVCIAAAAVAQPLASFRIATDPLAPATPGDTVDIAIRVDNPISGFESGGFNLFFRYDTTALRLLSAAPGSLLTDCAWELFTWRTAIPDDCNGDPCPNGLVHITALADYVIPVGEPLCWELSEGELVRLKFAVHSNPSIAGTSHPIEWFWYGCTDNELASKNGDSVYQSARVFDSNLSNITADLPIPTTTGAPLSCATHPSTTRSIDYYHGSIALAADSLQGPVTLRIAPQPLLSLYANALNPVICTLYIGNLTECSLADIDPATIRLNDTIPPLATMVIPPPDGFFGNVLAGTFDARSLVRPLMPIYDTINAPVAVTWTATESCVQGADTTVRIIGHRSGDVNGDGRVSISDVTALISIIFRGNGNVDPVAADVNGSGSVNVTDISILINRLFR